MPQQPDNPVRFDAQPILAGMFEERRDPTMPTKFGKVYRPDPVWLSKSKQEAALDPDIPIVDAHHHLWDLPGFRYLFDDFLLDLQSGHNVVGTVFNECQAMYRENGAQAMRPVGEVEFCAGIASMSESGKYGKARVNAGIVGFADLLLGDELAAVLEAQIRVGGGRFKGVRYAGAWDIDASIGNSHTCPGPGLYRDEKFHAGVKRLGFHGLTFDAFVFHPQLSDLVHLANACPEVQIICCHMGGPLGYGRYAGKRDDVFASWRAGMAELARCQNVAVKLGGVMMRLAAYDYGRSPAPITSKELAQLWAPYVLTCIELFGVQRCMVESNFPVDKIGIGYGGLWNAFKRMLSTLSVDEKEGVFSKTAKSVYRLQL